MKTTQAPEAGGEIRLHHSHPWRIDLVKKLDDGWRTLCHINVEGTTKTRKVYAVIDVDAYDGRTSLAYVGGNLRANCVYDYHPHDCGCEAVSA